MKQSYILEQFDQAIAQGWIEPTYQPIIRVISNTICGTQMIARWKDNKYGIISSDEFLPVLKKNRLIKKFDLYIIERVCQNIAFMERNSQNIIPTSIILSKECFLECDIVFEIEQIVSKYNISRDMLCFGISQSILTDKYEKIQKIIQRIKQLGYQIWLDDFSPNFDMANIFKNILFDEIKIDVSRLTVFDEFEVDMLSSYIKMIKKLGMQTIIVGVETKKQWEIIKLLGCDNAQGLYLCKTLATYEVLPFISRSTYILEKKAQRQYYEKICNTIKITEKTLAISEYDQKNFRILYMNAAFKKVCYSLGFDSLDKIDYMVNAFSSTLSRKFRYQQERTHLGDDFIQMDYSVNGIYFRLRSKQICENAEFVANQLEIENITKKVESDKENALDQVFRVMYSMYDSIFILRPDNKMLNVMRSTLSEDNENEIEQEGVLVSLEYAAQFIHPDDRTDFLETVNYDTLKEKLQQTEKGYDTKYYRSNTSRQQYVWKAHTYQYIPDMDWIIYSTKSAPLYQDGLMKKISSEYSEDPVQNYDKALLHQLKDSNTITYLWKDTQRRIVGVSRKFIEHFHIDDPSAIIGKRDEDLGWIVDINKAVKEEEYLLRSGQATSDHLNKIIANGVTHSIIASRELIYQNGKIVGLVCALIDIDDLAERGMVGKAEKGIDEITGLLSAQGMLDTVSGYIEAMMNYQEKFAIIQIKFAEQKYNFEQYGPVISEKITLGVASSLKEIVENNAVLARLYAGSYVILKKYIYEDDIRQFADDMVKRLKDVKEYAGYKVTLYPELKITFADKVQTNNEIIAVATGGSEFDLDQRKRLEEQLDSYNLQLDTIVDTIPGGIIIYEVCEDGLHITYASKGVAKITGRDTDTFISDFKNGTAGIFKKDEKRALDAFMHAVETNTELNVTYRLYHINGNTVWVNMQGKVIGEQNGHPLFLGVFRNLSESTSIYETILDESQAYIYAKSKDDGEILYSNLNVLSAPASKRDALSLEEQYESIRGACTADKIVNGAYRTGQERTQYEIELDGRNLLVFYVDGNWNGREATICYVSDITAKYVEEREKAARESLLFLEAINSSYNMVITFNLTKNSYNIYLNGPFVGYDWSKFDTYEQLIEEVSTHIPDNEDYAQQTVQSQLKKFKSGERYFVNEHQLYDSEGNLHWVSDRVVYATDPANGDVIGIVLTMFIDDAVRERNKQKETLQNALEEAMHANRAKSQFLSNMSHDIRTPMNAILGYTSIALDHIDEHDIIEDSLNKIQFSGEYLLDLINDILDMSRIEAGKETLNLSDVSMDEMEKQVRSLIEPLAEVKSIKLDIDTSSVKHRYFKSDMPKFRRIIVNVLSNATKFTNEQGSIQCQVTEDSKIDDKFGLYTICIKDTGIGMSPEFLEHIYELFAREKTNSFANQEGTGLGMAITKKYVDLMGGTIDVFSEQGVGTEVVIRLNLEFAKDISKREDEKVDSKFLIGKRILVVDDSELNRQVAQMMLEDLGMQVDTAKDGSDGVEKLALSTDGYYDCVLMDIRMPYMDGLTAARKIRSLNRIYLKEVPIIALSANVFMEDVKSSLNAGMNAHIGKPLIIDEFIKKAAIFLVGKESE
ncbi:hypothetical protein P261_02674 [Lachnospiraceae bacterium TWA4]|nr:hypothetical protein P261_02674 [Lachnospiraceae bacterium TWA4]